MDIISLNQWAAVPALGKITLFFSLWAGLWLPIGWGLIRQFHWPIRYPVPPQYKIPLLLSLYWIAPLLLWLYGAYGPGWSLADYGLTWSLGWLQSLLVGIAVGLAGIGLLIALQSLAGWTQWRSQLPSTELPAGTAAGPAAPLALLPGLLLLLPIALLALAISGVEELVFRGFVVNQLEGSYGPWAVLLLSSAIFAGLHLVWDGLGAAPQLPGLTLMGAVLLLARWVDGGQLGLPCGLHAGWIGALAWLDAIQRLERSPQAPQWLLGQPDLPLTNWLTLGLLTATGLGLWRWGYSL